ncbi:KIR protein [Plasmodium coatneyi]|uniref:KIR protein n=1 Tax=Plasmodium coatneyi TaxID=208452 RepID=A0A1B1E7U4_9APIC|nr:KIR protein [Plasmodium coatneyi]ANQ11037.1 KIR protein [Plasmodium coatneyi]
MSETAPVAPAGGKYLNETNLENLDSKIKFYKQVKGTSVYCHFNGEGGKLGEAKTKLNSCTEIKGEEDKIAKGLCFVTSKKKDAQEEIEQAFGGYVYGVDEAGPEDEDGSDDLNERFNYSLCHFLYYWLGDLVWKSNGGNNVTDGSKFSQIMHKIYEALPEFGVSENCTLLYKDEDTNTTHLDKTIFGYRKTVFDFTFDYKGIKGKLKKFDNSCDEKYYGHLDQACKAFETVSKDCNSKQSSYCKEFQEKYETDKDQNPLTLEKTGPQEIEGSSGKVNIYKNIKLELKYTDQYRQKLIDEKTRSQYNNHVNNNKQTTSKTIIIIDLYLDNLPSKQVYDTLDFQDVAPKNEGTFNPIKSRLQGIHAEYPDVSTCIDKIASAWYYITTIMGERDPRYPGRYNFFYYWLGSILWGKLKDTNKFPEAVRIICTKLPEGKGTSGCKNLYDKITKEQFDNMKKLYNHSQDYETIKQLLKLNGSRCTEKLKQYMDDIFKTYDKVKTECNGKSDEYCNNFESKYMQYCTRELANLSCSEGISAAATAAVSSILGIGALPAAVFFLYKHNLLPSWIKDNFWGGGRNNNVNSRNSSNRRKGRSGGKNWDTLTDNSTTNSTYDSTDVSTADSTIADSIDGSTVYGGQHVRRTYNAARYQKTNEPRNNIAYQRM